MAENEKVLTDKTGQDLIKATRDLNKSVQDLSKVQTKAISTTATASDIMKKSGSKDKQVSDIPSIGADGTSKYMKKTDPHIDYYKKSLGTLKEMLKVNKEMLANSMKNFGKGLGSLLAIGGLLGFLFTGKVELLYATAKGLIKGFIMPITKIIDHFVMGFAKNMLKEGSKISKAFKGIFADIGKKFGSIFGGLASNLLKKLGLGKKAGKKAVKTITRFRNAGGKFVKKGTEGAIKEVVEVGAKTVGKKVGKKVALEGAEALGKTAGVKGASALLKAGGKVGLKGLAKIPVLGIILGPVLGIIFAAQRWKKGDYIGALLEIGSGLASMIPVLGIPISLAIDVFLAFRDVKSSADDIKKQNSGVEKYAKGKSVAGNLGLKALARIPLFGAIIRPMLAMQKWKKGDKIGALMEVGSGLASLVPGIGTAVSIAIDAAGAFRDAKKTDEEKIQQSQNIGGTVKQRLKSISKKYNPFNMFKKDKEGASATPTVNQPSVVASATPTVNQPSVGASATPTVNQPSVVASATSTVNQPSVVASAKGDADVDLLQSTKKPSVLPKADFKPTSYSVPSSPESYMTSFKTSTPSKNLLLKPIDELVKKPFYFYGGSTIKGTLPKVEENFTKMAHEYVALTGTPLQVNSGYRSYGEQKALYLKYKAQGKEKYATNPDDEMGRPKKPSSHMAGKAIDINSGPADFLESTGLMDKYGFHRPLMQLAGQPQSIKEPWHMVAKPSLIGDAPEPTITNPEAINKSTFANNMDMMSSANDKVYSAIQELIQVTRESNKKLEKTVSNQKITSKQTISVNSLG